MKNVNNEIYQRMHGFKTVKRSNKKVGESRWYYIDPRYEDSDPRGQIAVSAENEINPKLGAILADDIEKNPQDYYIWRTKKDDRVRSKHAEREGEIFNWHIPPEGGHPGEDYNCRCQAEPYKPEKYKKQPMLVDISGLEVYQKIQKELRPMDYNRKSLPQYAANDKTNTASDAIYDLTSNKLPRWHKCSH